MAEVHVRTLQRAAEVLGGERELARRLKVKPVQLAEWLAGKTEPPLAIFLAAVDVVLDSTSRKPSSSS